MLFFKQAAFYKSVQGAFTYDVMAFEWGWGCQNTLFKERVYFLIWFILNVLYRILIAYHLLCLSRYLSSYLIANAHNDFAENFHFSNSSLSTVAPSIVPSRRVGKSLQVVGGKGFFFFLISTLCAEIKKNMLKK